MTDLLSMTVMISPVLKVSSFSSAASKSYNARTLRDWQKRKHKHIVHLYNIMISIWIENNMIDDWFLKSRGLCLFVQSFVSLLVSIYNTFFPPSLLPSLPVCHTKWIKRSTHLLWRWTWWHAGWNGWIQTWGFSLEINK